MKNIAAHFRHEFEIRENEFKIAAHEHGTYEKVRVLQEQIRVLELEVAKHESYMVERCAPLHAANVKMQTKAYDEFTTKLNAMFKELGVT